MKWLTNTLNSGIVFLGCLLLVVTGSCKSDQAKQDELKDTPQRGKIYVSADESFKPIIDAQVQVYEANNPGTSIVVTYKPEADCLRDFGTDSVRVIIATRGFTASEEDFMLDSMKVSPDKMVVARDAIAVIVNPASADSVFTMNELKQILTGKFKKDLIPIFDGIKATSTIRFIVDSVLRNDSLTPKAMAARSSEAVIDYVANTPGAVGFVGVSWIGNKEDTAQLSFLKKVKMAKLESTDIPGEYILPVQNNIYMKRYPMVRDLVYILKENYRGLGHGFTDFLSGQQGQLVFRRAYLVPTTKKFTLRQIRIVE